MTGDESPRKVCLDCGVEQPASAFWKRAASPDGLALYCKTCFGIRSVAAQERRAAREGRTILRQASRTADVGEGQKFCPGCQQVLDIELFVRNRSAKSGVGGYCRPCQNRKSKESIARRHGTTRHYHLKRRYGLGADDVLQMIRDQLWRCPICTARLTLETAHVDHDHKTGQVRAVVCFNCNGGLGQFKDNAAALRRAAAYVEGDVQLVIKLAPGAYRLRS